MGAAEAIGSVRDRSLAENRETGDPLLGLGTAEGIGALGGGLGAGCGDEGVFCN